MHGAGMTHTLIWSSPSTVCITSRMRVKVVYADVTVAMAPQCNRMRWLRKCGKCDRAVWKHEPPPRRAKASLQHLPAITHHHHQSPAHTHTQLIASYAFRAQPHHFT